MFLPYLEHNTNPRTKFETTWLILCGSDGDSQTSLDEVASLEANIPAVLAQLAAAARAPARFTKFQMS